MERETRQSCEKCCVTKIRNKKKKRQEKINWTLVIVHPVETGTQSLGHLLPLPRLSPARNLLFVFVTQFFSIRDSSANQEITNCLQSLAQTNLGPKGMESLNFMALSAHKKLNIKFWHDLRVGVRWINFMTSH